VTRTMRVELPNGKTILLGSPQGGLQEVSLASKLPQAAAGQFEAALETLGELVALLEKHVGAMVSRPSKVEIEFGATVSGEGNLWVVSGKGEAEFKVSLAWDGPK